MNISFDIGSLGMFLKKVGLCNIKSGSPNVRRWWGLSNLGVGFEMWITLQFPFADIRNFVTQNTFRLSEPSLPFVNPAKQEFVRSFGLIQYRKLGGFRFDEEVFCDAAKALRFAGPPGKGAKYQAIYRRLYSDGEVICRQESFFRIAKEAYTAKNFLADFLRTGVTLPSKNGTQTAELKDAGKHLAALYLYATTRLSEGNQLSENWVQAGNPLVFMELESSQATIPKWAKVVFSDDHLALYHLPLIINNLKINVWIVKKYLINKDAFRRLRLAVLRTHAELECLKQVLRVISQGKIINPQAEKIPDGLQNYLNNSITNLQKPKRYGIDQEEIIAVYRNFEEFVDLNERETLLDRLQSIRNNFFKNLEKFTTPQEITQQTFYITGEMVQVGGNNMTKINSTIGDGNTFHGDLAVAEVIKDSFNKTASAKGGNDELFAKLNELTELVAKLCEQLPPNESQTAARDLKTLVDESTSPAPRQEWYKLSAEGLIKAAKTCAALAGPIAETVKQILFFLK